MLQHPPPDAATVAQALAKVYARPELTPPPPSPVRVWLAAKWSALWEWVRSLIPGVELGTAELRIATYLVIGLLVVVALVVLLHLAGAISGWRADRRRQAPVEGALIPAPGADEVGTALYWETLARRAAEEGKWRIAVLALYQALVLRLDERGAVRYDAAKTPGDYRREVRGDAATGRVFEAFLRAYEPAAFGTRVPDGAGYGRLRTLAAEMGVRG